MCKETYFTYDDCDCDPPRAVRTFKCQRARDGLDCVTNYTHCGLSSSTCLLCDWRAEKRRRIEANNWRLSEMAIGKGKAPEVNNKEENATTSAASIPIAIEMQAGPSGTRKNVADVHKPVLRDQASPASQPVVNNVNPNMSAAPVPDTYLDPRTNLTIAHTTPRANNPPPGTLYKSLLAHIGPTENLEVLQWEVPSRCFIDPGFIRLDPWKADRIKQAELAARGLLPVQTTGVDLEDKENIDPRRKRSFPALRDAFHKTTESRIFDPFHGKDHEKRLRLEVSYRPYLDPCCAEKSWWKQQLGKHYILGEGARNKNSDDWCKSSF